MVALANAVSEPRAVVVVAAYTATTLLTVTSPQGLLQQQTTTQYLWHTLTSQQCSVNKSTTTHNDTTKATLARSDSILQHVRRLRHPCGLLFLIFISCRGNVIFLQFKLNALNHPSQIHDKLFKNIHDVQEITNEKITCV